MRTTTQSLIKLQNASSSTINPSTEEKQNTIILNQTNGDQRTKISFDNSSSVDAFGRLRTSTAHTLFDMQNQYNASTVFYENVLTGGGTVTHLPNESTNSLNVGTTNGDKAIRQTRNYFRYQPGKSQLIIFTRVFGTTKANVRKRSGYFDASNGLFFEDNGVNFGVVQRSYATGSVVDTRIQQTDWNSDKLDGNGPSGITLDLTKVNIFWMDFEWLGGGRVRFGIFSGEGAPITCHQFDNVNVNTSVYMTTPNLPVRNEIENTGTSASSTSFKEICTTVMNEDGGQDPLGFNFSASNGVTGISVTTRRAVLSIRPKTTFNSIVNRGLISDLSFEIMATGNPAYYEIVYGGALGGTPSWTSVNTNSITEYDVAGTTVTGGITIASGYVATADKSVSTAGLKNILSKLPLTLDIAGANPINISIVITGFAAGAAVTTASFNWKEIY